jgi:microcystin-dependent protein
VFKSSQFVGSLIFVLSMSSQVFAREGCNRHCLEKIYSQILTLREEMKNTIPIGTILPYSGFGALPPGYLLCDGSAVDPVKYRALFQVIGTTFTPTPAPAADQPPAANTTFRLPDLRGRVAVGAGKGTDLTERELGSIFGTENATLALGNLPAHKHGGTTNANNRGHTHTGRTEEDGWHNHEWRFGSALAHPAPNRRPAIGFARPDLDNETKRITGEGSAHRHQFTTGDVSQNHTHTFTTDNGTGLQATPFAIEQPSFTVRYMIKAE